MRSKCWPRCSSASYIDGGRFCEVCSPPDEYTASLIAERDRLRDLNSAAAKAVDALESIGSEILRRRAADLSEADRELLREMRRDLDGMALRVRCDQHAPIKVAEECERKSRLLSRIVGDGS